MGTRRFVYNRVLEKIKSKEETTINFYALRNKYVIAKNNPLVEEWQQETPKDIRAGAVHDLVTNYKSAFTNLKKKNIAGFKMGYCSRRDTPSIEIPKSAVKKTEGGIFLYKTYLPDKIKTARREKEFVVDSDCRLLVKNNQWFLCVPITVNERQRVEGQVDTREAFCAIDPGNRTFQTVYSDKKVVQIKPNHDLIRVLQVHLDKFRSLRARKLIKKKRLKARERKIHARMSNLIDDMHFKSIHYLTNTYKYIIIPRFETQGMAMKMKSRRVNRDLYQYKHFLYRQRLEAKCKLTRTTLDVCTEEYTSQTCGSCGQLTKIGAKDIYKCKHCPFVLDRDVNGARNIAIKRINEVLY